MGLKERAADRLMALADRFGVPVVSLVDTPGAFPGVQAEERGQAEAIARSTEQCLALKVPLLTLCWLVWWAIHQVDDPAQVTAAEVVHRWEEIKRQEKADQSDNGDAGSALDGVPKSLPGLLRAYQLQLRATRVGFDWPEGEPGYRQILEKVQEELREAERPNIYGSMGGGAGSGSG